MTNRVNRITLSLDFRKPPRPEGHEQDAHAEQYCDVEQDPEVCPPGQQTAHAVSSLSRLGSWNTTPNRCRTSVRCVVTSSPSSSSEPLVACNSVVSILMVVVFPAPFGPRNAKISPGRTSKETSLTAMTVPNDLTTCWTRMIGRPPTYALGAAGLAA